MRTFKFDRDPYGFMMYRKGRLTLEPGVTILIGCNGAGKTTMLHCLEGELKRKDIPTLLFSNLRDGGKQSISVLLESRRNNLAASMATASEGEGILISLGRLLEGFSLQVKMPCIRVTFSTLLLPGTTTLTEILSRKRKRLPIGGRNARRDGF